MGSALLLLLGGFLALMIHPVGQKFSVIRMLHRRIAAFSSLVKAIGLQVWDAYNCPRCDTCLCARFPWPRVQVKLKILFSFYGIATVLESTYDAKLPQDYSDRLHSTFSWAKVEWTKLIIPADECSIIKSSMPRFQVWLLTSAVGPLIIIGLAAIAQVVSKCSRDGLSFASLRAGTLNALPVALVISFAFVPSVSASIFKAWLCIEYTYVSEEAEYEAYSYLRSDLSVRCSSGGYINSDYQSITTTASIFVVGKLTTI